MNYLPPVCFWVDGTPGPKGSYRAVGRGKFTRVVSMSKKSKPWQKAVEEAARASVMTKYDEPVHVRLAFYLKRPQNHWKAESRGGGLKEWVPTFHTKLPDVDKLTRTTLDGLSGIAYADDSKVALCSSLKLYEAERGKTGCLITVETLLASSAVAVMDGKVDPRRP